MTEVTRRHKQYRGVIVPMITPLTPDGDVDAQAVERVIEYQLAGGVGGIFVLGTTGEAASLPRAQRDELVTLAAQIVNHRATVYAGLGENCLADAVRSAQRYYDLGADVIVARLPSFYQLTDAEQRAYFTTLVSQINGPVMIYNMPDLTGMSIPVALLEELSHCANVVGVKDSEFNEERLRSLIQRLGERDDFSVFTGPARMSAQMAAAGADGIIPAYSNLIPGTCADLFEAARSGDMALAETLQQQLNQVGSLTRGISFIATVKYAMSALDLCSPSTMLPLQPLSMADQTCVREKMMEYGMLPVVVQ